MPGNHTQAEPGQVTYKPSGPGPEPGRPDPREPTGSRVPGRGEVIDICRVPPASPYLVIRSWSSDLGLRPVAPVDTGAVSFSPDLRVTRETVPPGTEINVLGSWVSNVGLGPAAPVEVAFYLEAPSLSFPPTELNLVGTEYTIIPPLSSVLVERPVQGLLAAPAGASLVVRCSTPLDPRSDTLDPRLDRHVGVLRFGPGGGVPPIPTLPIDFFIINSFSSPMESAVEVSVERLRVPAAGGHVRDAVLRYGEREPDLVRHLEYLVANGVISRRRSRRILKSSSAAYAPGSLEVRRSAVASSQGSVAIDAELGNTSSRAFSAGAASGGHGELMTGAVTLSGLPAGRQKLVDDIRLEPFQSRSLRVSARLRESLRDDEVVVIHLFHIGKSPIGLLGRYAIVLSSQGLNALE